MTTVLKETDPLVVPLSVRRRAGMKPGDRLKFKAERGVITIVTQPPAARDHETPEQRNVIDAQVAVGLDDIRKGRVSRRFDTVEEMLTSLKEAPPRGTGKATRSAKTRAQ
jgi:bifunctional DNA-binding transcriptional regulator/antitoxin component of YhaV-PrlF toxin-antitoxin module